MGGIMKIMKFGGTSVGKPERMHQVSQLITADDESKIVVLSALSGTTNSLVDISNAMATGNKSDAKQLIEKLENHYKEFVKQLLKSDAGLEAAGKVLQEHFEFLYIILRISFSEALNKDILAQGELLSTKLFSIYLTENNIDHALLPALEFMTIDAYDEPQVGAIKVKLAQLLKQNEKKIYITQDISAAMQKAKWII